MRYLSIFLFAIIAMSSIVIGQENGQEDEQVNRLFQEYHSTKKEGPLVWWYDSPIPEKYWFGEPDVSKNYNRRNPINYNAFLQKKKIDSILKKYESVSKLTKNISDFFLRKREICVHLYGGPLNCTDTSLVQHFVFISKNDKEKFEEIDFNEKWVAPVLWAVEYPKKIYPAIIFFGLHIVNKQGKWLNEEYKMTNLIFSFKVAGDILNFESDGAYYELFDQILLSHPGWEKDKNLNTSALLKIDDLRKIDKMLDVENEPSEISKRLLFFYCRTFEVYCFLKKSEMIDG